MIMQKYTEQIAEQNNRNTMHRSRQNGIDQLIIFYFAHVLKKKKKLCVFKTLGSADYIKKNMLFFMRAAENVETLTEATHLRSEFKCYSIYSYTLP